MSAPLLWSDDIALTAVGVSFAVILAVQLGTARSAAGAPPRSDHDRGSGRLFTAASVAGTIGAWLASRVDIAVLPGRTAVVAVGLLMIWTGFALRTWARVTLGSLYDPVVTIHEDHRIITTGPYAIVRHPVYTGLIVTYLGLGLALGTGLSLTVLGVAIIPALVRRIRIEEHALTAQLGVAYTQYAHRREK